MAGQSPLRGNNDNNISESLNYVIRHEDTHTNTQCCYGNNERWYGVALIAVRNLASRGGYLCGVASLLYLVPLAFLGKEATKMKQRFRKTPMSQRKVYKYYDANERCVATIHPGDDNQVSEIHIKILHSMDDAEVYNNRKNSITAPVSGKAHQLNFPLIDIFHQF